MGYAKALLMEAEGLEKFIKLFNSFEDLSCEFLDEYGDYLDSHMTMAIEIVQYEVAMGNQGVFIINKVQHPGLVKKLADVLDEIQIFKAKGDAK